MSQHDTEISYAALLAAIHFAAVKHRDQRRKDHEASPYINHPLEMAELLARIGRVDDVTVLQGAVLHDTIEDTDTTGDELEHHFGIDVRRIVEAVTDDKNLPKLERKRLQIEHAPQLETRAKLVKLADKISNVRAVTIAPPAEWSLQRRLNYLEWSEQVVAGLRGCNIQLENFFDQCLREGRAALAAQADPQ